MKACLCVGAALAVVFVLDNVSCQIQDTGDVINVPEMDENIPSTVRAVITQQRNMNRGNDTVTFCEGFVSTENEDNVTWPRSSVGSTVGVVLQETICGVQIFRDCMEGGEWSILQQTPEQCLADKILRICIFVGYGVSLAACISAFVIFTLTRSSLRGIVYYQYHIHWNFVTSFILYLVVFIVNVFAFQTVFLQTHLWLMNILTALLAYFVLANFSWMLVEGLVLFVLVATSFPGPQRGLAFVKWLVIGWGIPAFLVSGWIITEKVMSSADTRSDFVLNVGNTNATNYAFLIGPTLAALVINAIVLVVVMRILWKKIKDDSRNTVINSREKSSWRAAKSTFVILILLGVYFALPIVVAAFEPPFLVEYVIRNVNNLMSSMQGLLVCILYVFCNAEVREQVKRALNNLRRRLTSSSHLTFSTRLSSPMLSRSATQRQSKSHSSSEGSGCSKRKPSDQVDSPGGTGTTETKRQTRVVMESLVEYPSECACEKADPAIV